jgi:hypothetical protein
MHQGCLGSREAVVVGGRSVVGSLFGFGGVEARSVHGGDGNVSGTAEEDIPGDGRGEPRGEETSLARFQAELVHGHAGRCNVVEHHTTSSSSSIILKGATFAPRPATLGLEYNLECILNELGSLGYGNQGRLGGLLELGHPLGHGVGNELPS